MTAGNFNWFLHSMLFYYTQHIIQKQNKKGGEVDEEENESDAED